MSKRDYYTISIPGDLAETVQELGDHAISQARDRARLHVMQAEWTAELISGDPGDFEVTFRVRRKRLDGGKASQRQRDNRHFRRRFAH